MNCINKRFWLFILVFAVFVNTLQAQETLALKNVLSSFEQKFNVKFSYVNSALTNLELEGEVPDVSNLEEALTYLQSISILKVVPIDARFISIALKVEKLKICGRVVDENQESVPYVSIVVLGTKTGTTTNEQGEFYFEDLQVLDTVQFRFLGFQTLVKNGNYFFSNQEKKGACFNVQLEPSYEEINEIVLSQYISNSISKLKDGTFVLNTDKFNILSGQVDPDLLQTSLLFSGIESVNESVADINVRGGANDQNVVYWDQIRLYHASHFFGLISAVNPYLTSKISIVKDGTSAKFNNGVSSSIFLETATEISEKVLGGVGMNFLAADVFAKIPVTKNFEINTSYRKSNTDWFVSPTYESYFKKTFQNNDIGENMSQTSFNFHDINLSALLKIKEKHHLKANYIKVHNDLSFVENRANALQDALQQNTDAVGLWYRFQQTENLETQVQLYHSAYSLFSKNYQNNQEQILLQQNKVEENTLKVSEKITFSPSVFAEFGYQLNQTQVLNFANIDNPLYTRRQNGAMTNHALFAEGNFKKNRFFVRAGLRANYFQQLKEATLEPRLNVNYAVNHGLDFSLRFEKKSQYTSQVVEFLDDFLGVENRRWLVADENIPIVTSAQTSLGVHYKKNKHLFDVTIFYKKLQDLLISGQGFKNQIYDNRITGSQRGTGLEFLYNRKLEKSNFWLSYTYSHYKLDFKEISATSFLANTHTPHSVTLGANVELLKNIDTSISALLRSGTPYSKPVEGNETKKEGNTPLVNYGDLNVFQQKMYSRVDASLSYAFYKSDAYKGSLKVGIQNLFNQKNTINTYYILDEEDTSKTKKIALYSLGFTPNISLRMFF
ncbi:carboxypeptidase-like regulatory domain-containing protein [Flavicella sediminum]|uniref:carboxypeptidase-like regulatory domain-containing protein n=1 Tax=Flavicella sediminum TaxID=2585141 RepID=UPI001409B736|nr:carboxypeptidase-like regulatory domain-containing protein [Flavicella sediminum]